MRGILGAALICLLACGDDSSPPPDGGGGCMADEDCSDGVFCSGIERCVEGACEMGNVPCPPPLLCDEAEDRCQSPGCDVAEDADGDGAAAVPCGGDDCDDGDADRFPGNPERCDDVDQDCDPATVGGTDADADGFVSAACCNGTICGLDCNDDAPAVGPTGTETCDGVDDDCDGTVDEGVLRTFFPDLDGDNFGDRDATPMAACARMDGIAENALDCDDGNASINPTGLEQCNGVDDNCNGTIDDPDSTALSCTATFGSPPNTFFACDSGSCGVSACVDGFADCNAEPSDGCEADTQNDIFNCGGCGNYCGVGGSCIRGVCDAVVDIAAGADFNCVVRSRSGRVVCWGGNDSGQLGDFSTTTRETPVIVAAVLDATSVETHPFRDSTTASCAYACAETRDLVYCWGCNRFGQMGDGDPEERSLMPEPVNGVPPIVDGPEPLLPGLTVGGGHACTRKDDDGEPAATLCWGHNDVRQVDDAPCADDICEATAVSTFPGTETTSDRVVAGWRHTCFVLGTETYCVGANGEGELGDGTRIDRTAMVQVRGGHIFTDLALGQRSSCGLRRDGAVLCWGFNGEGQLGDGTTTRRPAPTPVSGITNATDLCLGPTHGCAVLADGSARCWGRGNDGQLGDGRRTASASPVTVSGTAEYFAIACGERHTCAIDMLGEVWCWGLNSSFQVGPESLGTRVVAPVRYDSI